jgi:hypothetical protein
MHENPPYIDSPCHVVSNHKWHAMWFLTVEKLCSLKVEALKYGQEAPNLRSKKLQVGPKIN